MATKKKLIELDVRILEILEKQAKLKKRSLKNYLEHTLEEKAIFMSEPSEEYKIRMDDILERQKKGDLKTTSVNEFLAQYGRKI